MKTKTIIQKVIAASACLLGVGMSHADSILAIGSNEDSNYKAFVEGLGHTWTFKQNGGIDEQIGGDLDATKILGGVSQTQKAYLQSFDKIIIQRNSSSGNFTQPDDWATINKPIMVHNTFVARGSRFGMWKTDAGTFDAPFTDAVNETIVLDSGSSYLWNNVATTGNVANLYVDTQTNGDGVNVDTDLGTATKLGQFAAGGFNFVNLLHIAAGQTGFNGNNPSTVPFAADRVFFGYRETGNLFVNLSDDGKDIIKNFLAPLTPPAPTEFSIISWSRSDTDVTVTWESVAGVNYMIESSVNLSAWTELTPAEPGAATSTTATREDDNLTPTPDKVFYRVKTVP